VLKSPKPTLYLSIHSKTARAHVGSTCLEGGGTASPKLGLNRLTRGAAAPWGARAPLWARFGPIFGGLSHLPLKSCVVCGARPVLGLLVHFSFGLAFAHLGLFLFNLIFVFFFMLFGPKCSLLVLYLQIQINTKTMEFVSDKTLLLGCFGVG